MSRKTAFFAYPEQPSELSRTISSAAERSKIMLAGLDVKPWPQMSIFGAAIADKVREHIDQTDILLADVTYENFNVYYEIGYAIGSGKAIAPVVNVSFNDATKSVRADGFFDTIGYKPYENTDDLVDVFKDLPSARLIDLYGKDINREQPLYILDSVRKTDFRMSVVSAVKSSKVFYRSFDPIENSRFATVNIIGEVTSSVGVVIPFLSTNIDDAPRHNLRAAYLAGISHGLRKKTLLLQFGNNHSPIPLDYRDRVETYTNPDDLAESVQNFCVSALLEIQGTSKKKQKNKSKLQLLSLGSSAAENEFRTLDNYFVETSEYVRTLRGEANVVSGRKGSGKTAIFFMVRDAVRQKRNTQVTDLKPESHQLSLFRQELLSLVNLGVFDHTLAAFWYFVFLSEMLFTIRRSFTFRSQFDSTAYKALQELDPALEEYGILDSGDFTARINRLTKFVIEEVHAASAQNKAISPERLTGIVFRGGIMKIKQLIEKYSDSKTNLLLLFDNIDKGWPTNGVEEFDIRMVRIMLESLDKIRRDLDALDRRFVSVVFLRNDIYELLVEQTPDRGKAGQLRIDWNDRAKLRMVIHRRLQASANKPSENFPSLWSEFFDQHVEQTDSFEYCVDHCLMRPRFLITIIEYAVANAINRGHLKVQSEDLVDAVRQHSNYLISEFGFEIRDASGLSSDILYSLIGLQKHNSKKTIISRFLNEISEQQSEKAFQLLLWYGLLGIVKKDGTERYIYDYDYSIKRLNAEIKVSENGVLYCINSALHVALN